MVRLTQLVCPLMLRTNYRCVSHSTSGRSLQMWKIFTNTPNTLTFHLLQKMTSLVWTIHSWQAFNSLVCPLMLWTNNRCVESLNISVMSPNVENNHKFTQYTDYLSITKKKLSWLNNLFMVMFQLIRMSSYAKNKLQMMLSYSTSVWVNKNYVKILNNWRTDVEWLNNL